MPAKRPRKRYRVLHGPLFYPTDPEIIRRIHEGEDMKWNERRNKEVPTGAIVDDLPPVSIPILLAKRWIEEVKDA